MANDKDSGAPAPAKELDSASGAIIEPAVKKGVDLKHPAVDSNPRAKTTAEQNAIDFNDPQRRTPAHPDYVGQGLDPAPYGVKATSEKAE